MSHRSARIVLGLFIASGCAEDAMETKTASVPYESVKSEDGRGVALPTPHVAPPAGDSTPPAVPLPRKIIYNADVQLVVEDLSEFGPQVERLVQSEGGYLAEMDVRGTAGSHRSGTWKVRVPIERFGPFLDAVVRLGELERRQTRSQDVSEEFYDLQARIKNKRVEETRLLKHLEESTGELKDILDVERELSRVREEVERIEGRLQLLGNLTALTTVTLTANERLHYVPPRSPTFGTTVGRTFRGSVETLISAGKAVVILAVAAAPWVPLVVVAAWLARRAVRRRKTPARVAPASIPPA